MALTEPFTPTPSVVRDHPDSAHGSNAPAVTTVDEQRLAIKAQAHAVGTPLEPQFIEHLVGQVRSSRYCFSAARGSADSGMVRAGGLAIADVEGVVTSWRLMAWREPGTPSSGRLPSCPILVVQVQGDDAGEQKACFSPKKW